MSRLRYEALHCLGIAIYLRLAIGDAIAHWFDWGVVGFSCLLFLLSLALDALARREEKKAVRDGK